LRLILFLLIMKNFLFRVRFEIGISLFLLFITLHSLGQVNGPIKNDTVHLQVDMSLMIGTGLFHPSTDTVEVEGTMNPDSIKMMEQIGTGTIYKLTYVLPADGYYTFKFRINSTDTVYLEVADPSTRAFRVGDSTQTIFNYYNNYNPALIPMVFDCDMYYQIKSGNFSPAIDYLDVAGNFNNWGNDRIELFPRSTDSIYSFTIYFDTAAITSIPFTFKFRFNGDSSTTELKGDSNRVFTMTAANHNFFCWYDNIDPNVPALPFVYNVTINDSIVSKHTVTGAYSYGDYNLKPEGKSVYKWYTATEMGGALSPIDSAWSINYTIDSLLIGKYLVFEVKPITLDSVVGLAVQEWSPEKIVGVGLNEAKQVIARFYPNPVHSLLSVDFLQPVDKLEIINNLGQTLTTQNVSGSAKTIVDVGNLDPGVYFLKLIVKDNYFSIYKILKE
jgi:hypothetical protein